ncbi:cation/H(+) antiporter 4-like [Vicia villosa]|uniref:cation/H(+) antiporter 4-like n=1 Tax=Vicia villosa TaxID=3911 RepID=UPI00273BC97B|nr:cation/H(+) antiporter 4-like [Vicia villosa]
MNLNITANSSIFIILIPHNDTNINVCSAAPPNIVSDGIWGGQDNGRVPLRSALPIFELQVVVIFIITQICNFFLRRLHFPEFIGQMMAGLILGPSIPSRQLDKFKNILFPYGSQDILASISSIGYALFIFITAVQMDLSMVTRTGHKAWTFAVVGLAVPLTISFSVQSSMSSLTIKYLEDLHEDIPFVVLSHTMISFAVVASLLNELKILNSELGRLALSSVLVGDILGTSIGCLSNIIMLQHGIEKRIIFGMTGIAFALFVPLIFRPLMFLIIKNTKEGRPVDDGYTYIIIVLVCGLGWLSVYVGQDFILGAFVLGLAVPEGPPLGAALVKKLQFFCSSLFLPIFVTCGVMKVDLSLPRTGRAFVGIGSFVFLTHLIKMIAYVIPALLCKIPLKDALALSLILNAKGTVDVGIFSGLYDDKLFSGQTYGVMIVSIMIISCIIKWSLKILYDPSRKYAGYQRRTIMSLKPEAELRILACIHKQYNIPAITDVLDICSPTTEKPIIVDALHLIELVGRTSPIFISHRLQKTVSCSHKSYSDDLILALDLYEHENYGGVTSHTFTAISPPSLMHEDVCQLALDKVASIIILPFHRRWTTDGTVESDDKNIRALNCKVLEIAPCTIGILVTRSLLQNNMSIKLAMVFLGGRDDREALCLVKRAIRNTRIRLVVFHLAVEQHMPNLENLLDNEALDEIKKITHYGQENVRYQKVTVNDGPATSAILRDIANEHDFFIVGRTHDSDLPQTEGLTNWSEFSELGVIGDLLASPDFESRAGVLVVQQQVKDK